MSVNSKLRYFIAFSMGVCLYLIFLCLLHLEPFQSKAFLTGDLLHQYYTFHVWLSDAVRSGNWGSLLYNWNAGLGNSMIGTYAYYLSSPFSLLACFFNENTMPLGLTFITTLKIGSISLSFYWLLTKLSRRHRWSHYLFALFYTFCGFTITYLMNFMWLDQLIFLPILIYTGLQFLHRHKKTPLFIALVLSFFSNFYTAYMSGLFLALFLSIEFFSHHSRYEWKKLLSKLLQLLGLALIAASLLAFLFLPTALQLFSGNESALSFNFRLLFEPIALIEQFTLGSYSGVNNQAYPPLYFGLFPMILTLSFFFRKDVSMKERLLHGGLTLFLLISFLIDPLFSFWHAFKYPAWYPGRHAFIFAFYMIYIAYRAYELQRKTSDIPSFLYSLTLFTTYLSFLTIAQGFQLFSSNQAAPEMSLGLTWFFLFLYGALIFLHFKLESISIWRILLYLAFAEISISSYLTLHAFFDDMGCLNTPYLTTYLEQTHQTLDQIQQLQEETEASSDYVRLNLSSTLFNEPLLFDYPGLISFNTLNNPDHIYALNHLTSSGIDSFTTFSNADKNPLINSLLGVRYLYGDPILSDFYESTAFEKIYYNPYALPLGFKANSELLEFVLDSEDPLTNQTNWLNAFLGTSSQPLEFYKFIDSQIISSENLVWDEELQLFKRIDLEKEGFLKLRIHRQDTAPIYASFSLPFFNASTITLEIDGEESEQIHHSTFIQLPEGEIESAIELSLTCSLESSSCGFSQPQFFYIQMDALKTALSQLKQEPYQITSRTSTQVTGTLSFEKEGLLFLSIPYHKGWSATLNGEPITPLALQQAFLGFMIPEGTHELTLTFNPPGWSTGLLISILSFNGLTLIYLWRALRS